MTKVVTNKGEEEKLNEKNIYKEAKLLTFKENTHAREDFIL